MCKDITTAISLLAPYKHTQVINMTAIRTDMHMVDVHVQVLSIFKV